MSFQNSIVSVWTKKWNQIMAQICQSLDIMQALKDLELAGFKPEEQNQTRGSFTSSLSFLVCG